MASVQDFSKLMSIDGVKSYYLARYEGTGIASQGGNAESIFPFVAFSGMNCDAVRPLLGFSKFKHTVYSRKSREDVIVFSLSNYFLAVIKQADTPGLELIENVGAFIQTIINANSSG